MWVSRNAIQKSCTNPRGFAQFRGLRPKTSLNRYLEVRYESQPTSKCFNTTKTSLLCIEMLDLEVILSINRPL